MRPQFQIIEYVGGGKDDVGEEEVDEEPDSDLPEQVGVQLREDEVADNSEKDEEGGGEEGGWVECVDEILGGKRRTIKNL